MELTERIHDAGSVEITNAEEDVGRDRDRICHAISKLTEERASLLESIQNVETELRECINRLEKECDVLKAAFDDSGFIEIHSLETDMVKLEKEIRDLDDQAQEARRQDRVQQDLVHSLEKRLEERKGSKDSTFTELDGTLDRDKREVDALQSKLDGIIQRTDELCTGIEAIETASRPDYREFIRSEQHQMDEHFEAKMDCEVEELKVTKQKRRALLEQQKKSAEVCNAIAIDIEALVSALSDPRDYCRKAKRKMKVLSLQIAKAEAEVEILKRPDPLLVAQLRQFQQDAMLKITRMKVQLDALVHEETELKRKSQLYRLQNTQMREYLEPFAKIRHYYLTHKPASVKPRSPRRGLQTPARVVLECSTLNIHAS
jgi:chromosome segregation ATPase